MPTTLNAKIKVDINHKQNPKNPKIGFIILLFFVVISY